MTYSGDPDRRRSFRRRPDDQARLEADPSLRELVGRGWVLDRFPTASTAWAFVATLGTSLIVADIARAALVAAVMVVGVGYAGVLLVRREAGIARNVLRLMRTGMLAWLVTVAALALVPPPADPEPAPVARPARTTCTSSPFTYQAIVARSGECAVR